MKKVFLLLACLFANFLQSLEYPLFATKFFDHFLDDQNTVKKINFFRPPIYIYTDFGGGENSDLPISDLQTCGELASAAWKSVLQQTLFINDSAKPLSPIDAAVSLVKTFPYNSVTNWQKNKHIQAIVVHVIDPGVGNDQSSEKQQLRSIVLRKDGVLFIGPDNGTLSFVFPESSIEGIWEINAEKLAKLAGIDVLAGGTFHGRDIFGEAAFRISSGTVTVDEIGIPYPTLELRNKFSLDVCSSDLEASTKSINFLEIDCSRFVLNERSFYDENSLFGEAYLLGLVQSSLYNESFQTSLTSSKKLFFVESIAQNPCIAVINKKTGNIYVGPNNGLGTAFFKNFEKDEITVHTISSDIAEKIQEMKNNESIFHLIAQQPLYDRKPQEITFQDESTNVKRDSKGRPLSVLGKIWIDLYGNIKTTILSTTLNEAKKENAQVAVEINGICKNAVFAETFSQVPQEELFVYSGSSAAIGPNPHRSIRYVEVTANGVYGKFGYDFFRNEVKQPSTGDYIQLLFKYPN